MERAISYYRVSTERQGRSGLGLEAQQKTVHAFAQSNHLELLTEYTEIESGRNNKRPILAMALKACKKEKATLIIAKLDRLSRNVAFVSALMESKISFLALDIPYANRFTVHIMAASAENERELISIRTTNALKVARERGVQLGKHGKEILSKKNKQVADDFAFKMAPVIDVLHREGYATIREMTDELNRRNIPTFRGSGFRWHVATLHQIVTRLKQGGHPPAQEDGLLPER